MGFDEIEAVPTVTACFCKLGVKLSFGNAGTDRWRRRGLLVVNRQFYPLFKNMVTRCIWLQSESHAGSFWDVHD